MNRVLALALFTFSIVVFAQAPHINSGATVYIEPNGGYEMSLTAAITEKQVPLTMVADKSKAKYIITSTRRSTPGKLHIPHNLTNIAVTDAKSSQIVFAYSADKGGETGSAEAFAEHLKEFIEEQK